MLYLKVYKIVIGHIRGFLVTLDKDFLRLIRTIKSNKTDTEAHEIVMKELSSG